MRVSIVTETYPPEVNGVAMTVGRLTDGLRLRGHEVDVLRPRQGRNDDGGAGDIVVPGLPLPGYPGLRFGLPATGRLLKHWRERRPDVVHVVTEGPLGWSATAAARKLSVPITSGFHTNFDRYSAHYRVGFLRPALASYLRSFHRRACATMVPTETLAAELAGCGIPGIRVVRRGVDTELFSPERRSDELRRRWGVGSAGLAVAYVGRVAPEKNIGLALSAFEAIARQRPGARMIVVGDGPARRVLERSHPQHHFAGVRTGEDLAAHYASADMFVFPSLTETFGNVTLEAMASGLPVVAYRSAAAAELIRDGDNGVSVLPGDASAFIDAAAGVACDESLRRRIGEAAALSALGWGWASVVQDFETVLHEAVAGQPQGAA
ncbi:MAG: glycosyltransferase family 1 protein [Zoogloea sp.]|nr:glycosyltransferase family 1 protein [Zoogloea sp.]